MQRIISFCDSVPYRYGEAFAKHPLFDSFATVDAETKKMVKIDESNFEMLKLQRYGMMKEYLGRKDSLFGVFLMIRKPDRFNVLYIIKDLLEEKEFNDLLSATWIGTEFPYMYGVRFLNGLFKRSKPELLMNKEELEYYNYIPDFITVYRGIQNLGGKKKTVRGLSWTLNKQKAVWFANRFHGKGDLYKAMIKKKDIYCYFSGRKEDEIVLNPYCLKTVERIDV